MKRPRLIAHPVELVQQFGLALWARLRQRAAVGTSRGRADVGARAETAARAGHDHRPDVVVVPDLVEDGEGVLMEPPAEGIQLLRSVESDEADVVLLVEEQVLVGHGESSGRHAGVM